MAMEKKGKTGLIHIYCGDGKGKTTAGMGLCLRAAGSGYRVLICQFMKDDSSGELAALESIPGITIVKNRGAVKFSFRMSEEEKISERKYNQERLENAFLLAADGGYNMLFLDEAIYAVRAGLMDEEKLLAALREKPARLEVILTGRNPGEKLLAMADYVSEVRKIRHPFDREVPARKGIEF